MGEAALQHQLHGPSRGRGHERHRSEATVLHRTVSRRCPAFLERAGEHGALPRFVVREVEEHLRCGLLEHGGVRVACSSCAFERLVEFSCRRRGFCPSCLGRRMADLAVHLEQQVFPEAPVRQWVCSMPWSVRAVLGYHRKLCADVVSTFLGEVSRSLEHRAKRELGLFEKEGAEQEGLPRRRPWARLLRHVFQVDISTCPACGRAMRLLETATSP